MKYLTGDFWKMAIGFLAIIAISLLLIRFISLERAGVLRETSVLLDRINIGKLL